MDSKAASNTAAESRIDSLQAYVDDIKAGKIEFTTERADLELQEKELTRSLEKAAAIRESEKKDFEAAKQEMTQALAALEKAIQVLKEGQGANLVSVRWSLKRASELAEAFLGDDRDAKVLAHWLDNQPEEKDWKKLNRKATFKKKYTAQSTEITAVLEKLQKTIEKNLADAEEAEAKAEADYQALKESKEALLKKTQDALQDMVKEGAARGLSMEEAEAEIAALQDQISSDSKYMQETETTCQDKATVYAERVQLRQDEIAAIGQAISVLMDDENRDTLTKAYSFMQLGARRNSLRRPLKEALLAAARVARDPRPALLAKLTQEPGWQTTVIEKIDELKAALEEEA